MDIERRRYLEAIGATVWSLSLAGCTERETESSEYVEILHHEWASKADLRVEGEAKNISDQSLPLVTIKVAWLENGAFISNDMSHHLHVDAGATVSFEAEHTGTFGNRGNPEDVITGYSVSADAET